MRRELGILRAASGLLAALCPVCVAGAGDPSPLSDADLERTLRKGKIVKREEIGTGVTRPKRLWIDLDGVLVSASFKSVDMRRRGVTRFASGNAEINFSDSFRYERAAYLLDRRLGLHMVPVTVYRHLRRQEGAVTLWIGNSLTEAERIQQGQRPADMRQLLFQQTDMRIFDALIYNTDRHTGNQLYSLADWRLHLIDHSRAFRTRAELPEGFAERPVSISRELLERLESLDADELGRLLKRELGPEQIKSLMLRRDLILEKIERGRQELGDAYTFREEE